MQIGLLTEHPDDYRALADALRVAGHTVRLTPALTLDGESGFSDVEALLVPGVHCPASISEYAKRESRCCVIALLREEEMASYLPTTTFTDFVVQPFRVAEIAARISLHRTRQQADDPEVIRSGNLVIDVSNYTIEAHGERVGLTFKEYELLKFLVTHAGRVFSRESLLEQVWGYDYWGGSRTIDVHIRRIRSKLPLDIAVYIETVHQVGYRYAIPKG